MAKSVLVIAAHRDDEVLGCCGAIAKLASQGAEIHLAFLADGIGARPLEQPMLEPPHEPTLQRRRATARQAADILGAASVSFEDLPDNRLETLPLLEPFVGVHQ